MTCILVAASFVVASFCASAQKLSCGALAVGLGRRPDTAPGCVLLQTKTKASTVLVPGGSGTQHENSSAVDEEAQGLQGLPDDASMLSVGMGRRSAQARLEAQQRARVPLGMPGSAASLLTVLRMGALQPTFSLQGPEGSHFRAKLAIYLIMIGLLGYSCTSPGAGQQGARASKHEALTRAGLTQGASVKATRTFISDGEVSSEISPGQEAKILLIDEDADIVVKFETVKLEQWVRYRKALEVLQPVGDTSPCPARVDSVVVDERADGQALAGAGMASPGLR